MTSVSRFAILFRSPKIWCLSPGHAWIIALLFVFFSPPVLAQETITIDGMDCGLHGTAQYGNEAYYLNAYKNRYKAPLKADFDNRVSLLSLIKSGDPNQFSQEKAAVVQGFVVDIKIGGVETCNCRTKDPQYRDTHIELVPDESHTGVENRVIIEVTPRLRTMMRKRGVDWSTEGLRKSIKGRRVEVAGWLTYDAEHESAAFANDPGDVIGEKNWRATCWEIHPVTYLNIITGKRETDLSTIEEQQGGRKGKSTTTDNNANDDAGERASGLLIGLVLLLLLLVYLLLRKKLK